MLRKLQMCGSKSKVNFLDYEKYFSDAIAILLYPNLVTLVKNLCIFKNSYSTFIYPSPRLSSTPDTT